MAEDYNITTTLMKFGVTFVGGVFSGLIWPFVRGKFEQRRKRISDNARKVKIHAQLQDLAKEISKSVRVMPHGVENKGSWVKRLRSFTNKNLDCLGALDYSIEKIAWRIEDSSFDHTNGKPVYCCDQLISDLELLKLAILELIANANAWDGEKLDTLEKAQMKKVVVIFWETPPGGESGDKQVSTKAQEWHREWKEKTFRVGTHLAMAHYINTRAIDVS